MEENSVIYRQPKYTMSWYNRENETCSFSKRNEQNFSFFSCPFDRLNIN